MTPTDIQALRDERVRTIKAAREIVDAAEAESRSLTSEERQKYDELFEAQSQTAERISMHEQLLGVETELSESTGRRTAPRAPKPSTTDPTTEDRATTNGDVESREYERPYEFRYRLQPERGMPPVERVIEMQPERASAPYQLSFRRYLQSRQVDQRLAEQIGKRDLQADSQTAGGGVVPSEQFVASIIKFVDDRVYLRQFGTVINVGRADSLGAPSYDADPADADWNSEVPAALTSDTTQVFGKRELHPWICTKLVKVSRKLLRVSAINLEQFVRERLGYKLAITHEKAFLTGSGANQPLGVFTASAKGISTGQDVSSGNTTTTIGADGLIAAKYNLKAQYRMRARWLFHRDAVKQISQLKDANGQYLWRPGLVSGDPDQLLGMPIFESEYAPNTFTTGLYVGIIGDFTMYWIADSLGMEILRLDEKYSDTLQVGFQLMAASDGMPVLEEAFTRVTLA